MVQSDKKSVEITQIIRDALKNLGFTDYFINIYSTLLVKGELNAHELSEHTGVPYSRIYEVLGEMQKREMITKIDGRPSTFIGNDPQEMFKSLKKQRDEEFDLGINSTLGFLKELYGEKAPAKKVEFTLYEGEQSCRDHFRNVLNSTARQLLLIINDFDEIYPIIKTNLDILRTKGVEIKFLVEERLRKEVYVKELVQYAKVRFSTNINHNMMVCDEKQAIQSIKGHFDIVKQAAEDYVIFGSTNSVYVMYITEIFKRKWNKASD